RRWAFSLSVLPFSPGCGRARRWARPRWSQVMAEQLQQTLPAGAMDTRASGWWAMIFTIFTEASLFVYLLFSYYYLAVHPHAPGTFPEGGAPPLLIAAINTAILLTSSVAVGWAQFGIERNSRWRLVIGLGLGAV